VAELLSRNLPAFAKTLRDAYDIDAGHARAHDALRALEAIGVESRSRAKHALRTVFCSHAGEIERFDRAFDAFFWGGPAGVRQPRQRDEAGDTGASRTAPPECHEATGETAGRATATLRARYSPSASGTHDRPEIAAEGLAETLADAGRLVASLRLGRSRRWKANVRGERFDLRRTLRASLQTGGIPLHVRTLGHPLRNPRVVVLLDASRSMSPQAGALLQMGYALCRRSRRARVFTFSTALREITRELRAIGDAGSQRRLRTLGEAWGGGTRIGESLRAFVRANGSRLDADTLVVIASDGLDAGDVALVKDAMRRIDRRCAGIVWLNPHAGQAGFEPAAAGMRAALPYVSALVGGEKLAPVVDAARQVRR
jgi:uncharacterized protein with von Willebrand factor type A (vWA) domain